MPNRFDFSKPFINFAGGKALWGKELTLALSDIHNERFAAVSYAKSGQFPKKVMLSIYVPQR